MAKLNLFKDPTNLVVNFFGQTKGGFVHWIGRHSNINNRKVSFGWSRLAKRGRDFV